MEEKPTYIMVVAALIQDASGRFLLQQGLLHKRHAGLWEFPGGKVEPGEMPRGALAREIVEELGMTLDPGAMRPAGFAEEAACEGRAGLVLFLYSCPSWSGEPEGREGQVWAWFTPREAAALAMPPMDAALLAGLPFGGSG